MKALVLCFALLFASTVANAGSQTFSRVVKSKISSVAGKTKNFFSPQRLRNGIASLALATTVGAGSFMYQPPAQGFFEQALISWAILDAVGRVGSKMSSGNARQQSYPSSPTYYGQTTDNAWRQDPLMVVDGSVMTKGELLVYVERNIQIVNEGLENLMETVMPYHLEYQPLFNDARQAYDNLQSIVQRSDELDISASSSIEIMDRMFKAKLRLDKVSEYKGVPIAGRDDFGWIGIVSNGNNRWGVAEGEYYFGILHADVHKYNALKESQDGEEFTATDYAPGGIVHYFDNGQSFVGRAFPVNPIISPMFPNTLLITDHIGGHPQRLIDIEQISGVDIISSTRDLWGYITLSNEDIDSNNLLSSNQQEPTIAWKGSVLVVFSDGYKLVEVRWKKPAGRQEYQELEEPVVVVVRGTDGVAD